MLNHVIRKINKKWDTVNFQECFSVFKTISALHSFKKHNKYYYYTLVVIEINLKENDLNCYKPENLIKPCLLTS